MSAHPVRRNGVRKAVPGAASPASKAALKVARANARGAVPKPSARRPVAASPAEPFAHYVPHNYQPEESVGYLMRRILSTVSAEIEREMSPNGLTNAQWIPLFKLHVGSASTVAELARECDLDAGAMTRTLDRLEAKGLLRRVRSGDDRRVVNLELTDEGRVAANGIPQVLCRVQNAHLTGFSGTELQTLKTLLRRILANAQALHADKKSHE
ncbi:MAG: MarR family transcriptional regulator [Microbacteriaceae bacterium]|nr:MarR family transcriptional regulator [Burkholderiaceae bacterium]